MEHKKLILFAINVSVILLLGSVIVTPTVQAGEFHILKGTLYVDDEVMGEGAQIKVNILTDTFYFDTFDPDINGYTYYLGGFQNDTYYGATAYFTVLYNSVWYTPIDNSSIILDKNTNPEVENYIFDMHIDTSGPGNNPPDQPTLISPEDGSTVDSNDSATLEVGVSDPDDDPMDVYFYDNSDDGLIGTVMGVVSGGSAQIEWSGLSANTTYSWYAVANDTELETKSDTWSFTTNETAEQPPENEKPNVSIVKPCKGLYLFNRCVFPRFFRLPLIIGKITIIANATDEDSGIEMVEFYINGRLMGNDTTEPYTYNWTRDRIRLIHVFSISVKAYDNEGATDIDCMLVRKYL